MSDISKMTDKQLRNEVQLLRDELAIMKRKYEDIIYNLDTDNFSSRFVKEQGDMKTAIEVTAKGIKTKVSNEEFESEKIQTATLISSEIKKLDDSISTKITQTEDKITLSAYETKEYVTNLLEGDYVKESEFSSLFSVEAEGIYSEVSRLDTRADNLSSSISSVSQTADDISFQVSAIDNGTFQNKTLFTQSSDKFYFDGEKTVFTGCIWLTDNSKKNSFSISHDESQNAQRVIYLHNPYDPLVIGRNQESVYIASSNTDDNLIATRGWVNDHAGSGGTVVARFG